MAVGVAFALSALLCVGLEINRVAAQAGPSELSVAFDAMLPGTTITVRPGDSVYGLARTIYPHDEKAVHDLAQAIVLANPALFPDGRGRPLRVGEQLTIPDLRTVKNIVAGAPLSPKKSDEKAAPETPTVGPSSKVLRQPSPTSKALSSAPRGDSAAAKRGAAGSLDAKPDNTAALPQPRRSAKNFVSTRGKLNLKLATSIDLSRSRGITEKRRPTLRGELQEVTGIGTATTGIAHTTALSLRVDRIRELQDGLNARLIRLEAATQVLRQALLQARAQQSTPLTTGQAPTAPRAGPGPAPRPELVTSQQPMAPLWRWSGIGALFIVLAISAFFVGRRFQKRRALADQTSRIDAMLEEARSAATPLLGPEPVLPTSAIRSGVGAHVQPSDQTNATGSKGPPAAPYPSVDGQPWLDTTSAEQPPEAPVAPSVATRQSSMPNEPTPRLRLEMDDAMDSTRSMFSDVDRFIMLGRIENAMSLLEFQIKRSPADRSAWVKLMALYRQQGMDDDFDRVYAGFREQFGDDPNL